MFKLVRLQQHRHAVVHFCAVVPMLGQRL
jgi:hypothetical protein